VAVGLRSIISARLSYFKERAAVLF